MVRMYPTFFHSLSSVDDDQSRSVLGPIGHGLDVGEAPPALGEDGDGQPVHEVLVVREERLDGDGRTLRLDDGEVLHDGLVLLVDVDEFQVLRRRSRVRCSGVHVKAEPDHLRPRRRGREQVQRQERLGLDGVEARARPGHDEGLVQRVEGEVARAGRQEGQLGGHLALEDAVPALLLPLLAQDGRDAADQRGVAVPGEGLDDVLQGAEDDGGEGAREGDGRGEVRDGEPVLAGLDGLGAEVLERAVGVKGVEFFLLLLGIRLAYCPQFAIIEKFVIYSNKEK